jgi:hypothetical protein
MTAKTNRNINARGNLKKSIPNFQRMSTEELFSLQDKFGETQDLLSVTSLLRSLSPCLTILSDCEIASIKLVLEVSKCTPDLKRKCLEIRHSLIFATTCVQIFHILSLMKIWKTTYSHLYSRTLTFPTKKFPHFLIKSVTKIHDYTKTSYFLQWILTCTV